MCERVLQAGPAILAILRDERAFLAGEYGSTGSLFCPMNPKSVAATVYYGSATYCGTGFAMHYMAWGIESAEPCRSDSERSLPLRSDIAAKRHVGKSIRRKHPWRRRLSASTRAVRRSCRTTNQSCKRSRPKVERQTTWEWHKEAAHRNVFRSILTLARYLVPKSRLSRFPLSARPGRRSRTSFPGTSRNTTSGENDALAKRCTLSSVGIPAPPWVIPPPSRGCKHCTDRRHGEHLCGDMVNTLSSP